MAHSTTKNIAHAATSNAKIEKKTFRRKKWLIDPSFQLVYIMNIYLLAAAFAVAGSAVYMFYTWTSMESGLEKMGIESNLPIFVMGFAFLIFLIAPFLCVFLSHRVVGPVFKFRKSIKKIIAGDRDFQVTLRQMDNFKEVAEEFNDMIHQLKKEQKELQDLKAILSKAKAKIEAGKHEEAAEAINSVQL